MEDRPTMELAQSLPVWKAQILSDSRGARGVVMQMLMGEGGLPNTLTKVDKFDKVMQSLRNLDPASHRRLLAKAAEGEKGFADAFMAIAGPNGRRWENLRPNKLHAPLAAIDVCLPCTCKRR